jgi:hypothetical protein
MGPGQIRVADVDPAAAVGALVESVRLMLDEMRRSKSGVGGRSVRDDLIDLEMALSFWAGEADFLNLVAARWADDLPQSAGSAGRDLGLAIGTQGIALKYVIEAFRHEPGTSDRFFRRGVDPTPTVEDLLRIYAPRALDSTSRMAHRQHLLRDGIGDALEERFAQGGIEGVRSYLEELRDTQLAIENCRAAVAEFIATEFPLNLSDH